MAFSSDKTNFLRDNLTTGQDCDVLQHSLATIAKTRSLNSYNLDDSADVVNNQRRECFAFNVFCDDHQWTAGLGYALEDRQQVTNVRNLLVEQQDQRVVVLDLLARLRSLMK